MIGLPEEKTKTPEENNVASEEQTEEPVAKVTRVKRQKRKPRFSPQIYKFYQIKDSKITKLRNSCPRCGKGIFLAEHSDRLTCGKCGYTDFKKALKIT